MKGLHQSNDASRILSKTLGNWVDAMPYSIELKEKALAAIQAGQSAKQVAKELNISLSCCYGWKQQAAEGKIHKPLGRPAKLEPQFKDHALKRLLRVELYDGVRGDELWSWQSVRTLLAKPTASRQTVIRFLMRCNIHPGRLPALLNQLPNLADFAIKSTPHILFLVEASAWIKPVWFAQNDTPQLLPTLWRVWDRRGSLLFAFTERANEAGWHDIAEALEKNLRSRRGDTESGNLDIVSKSLGRSVNGFRLVVANAP
jgi:transposase